MRTGICLAYDKTATSYDDFIAHRKIIMGLLESNVIDVVKFGHESLTALTHQFGVLTSYGLVLLDLVHRSGKKTIVDLKIDDIPNTVGAAIYNLTGNAHGVTVYISGGPEMLEAAVKAGQEAARVKKCAPLVIFGVTVPTSMSEEEFCRVHHFESRAQPTNIENAVKRYIETARDAGLSGLVCSGPDLKRFKDLIAGRFVTLVPGGRDAKTPIKNDDQKHTMTFEEIAELGAHFAVCGRPIWQGPESPIDNAKKIKGQLA